jgi:hypothetical protein
VTGGRAHDPVRDSGELCARGIGVWDENATHLDTEPRVYSNQEGKYFLPVVFTMAAVQQARLFNALTIGIKFAAGSAVLITCV